MTPTSPRIHDTGDGPHEAGTTQLEAAVRASESNFADALREQVRWTSGARLIEGPGFLLTIAPGLRYPVGSFNAVLRVERAVSAARVLDAAERTFGEVGRPFCVYVRQQADADLERECRQRRYLACGELAMMALDPARLTGARTALADGLGAEVDLVQVATVHDVERFREVAAQSFASVGVPAPVTQAAFSIPARLLDARLRLLLACCQGRPAACGLSLASGGTAGLYWIGTLPLARGRGLGSACVTALARLGLQAGARCMVLQAAPHLEAFYAACGFHSIGRLTLFARLGAAPARDAASDASRASCLTRGAPKAARPRATAPALATQTSSGERDGGAGSERAAV